MVYGHRIHSVIHPIRDTQNTMTLRDKLAKCMRFITVLKRTIARQYKVEHIATHRLQLVIIFIARKLITTEHMFDEIERTHDQQIPRLAEIRSKGKDSIPCFVDVDCYGGCTTLIVVQIYFRPSLPIRAYFGENVKCPEILKKRVIGYCGKCMAFGVESGCNLSE